MSWRGETALFCPKVEANAGTGLVLRVINYTLDCERPVQPTQGMRRFPGSQGHRVEISAILA